MHVMMILTFNFVVCQIGFNYIAVVLATLAGIIALGFVVLLLVRKKMRRANEAMWRIKTSDLVYDDPPEILGNFRIM